MVPPVRARAALIACLAAMFAMLPASALAGSAKPDRYALASGCFALKSLSNGKYAVKSASGYSATAADAGGAEAFRMKATELGAYLLFGKAQDFLGGAGDRAAPQAQPTVTADWRVENAGDGFTLTLPSAGKALAVDGDGNLVVVDAAGAGDRGIFAFDAAEGCALFPEVETNVSGEPSKPASAFGELSGMIDAHMHMMAFEFLGGSAHCAKPWDRFGVTVALVDCPDHQPNGAGAALENVLSYKNPARVHDPVGWPTFKDWPAARS